MKPSLHTGVQGRRLHSGVQIDEAHRPHSAGDHGHDRTLSLIRPFTVAVPDAEIQDLKQRLARTRWPSAETVSDWSQGVRLQNAQALVAYWAQEYDWRRFESELNRFPQFLTTIDGLDIHFIHVRSQNPNAMPLILTHGWPGSFVDFLKLIGPLTDPVAFGGDIADSFDVVIPSMPGFGFSQKPEGTDGRFRGSRARGRN